MMGMNAATGLRITESSHISQSIGKILTTPLGSRVMRREFGSVIPALIDQPLNQATVLRVFSSAVVAIREWEPRVRVGSISRSMGEHGQFTLDITLTRTDTGETEQVQIAIGGTQ